MFETLPLVISFFETVPDVVSVTSGGIKSITHVPFPTRVSVTS